MRSAPAYSQAEIDRGIPELLRHRSDPIAFMQEILGVEYVWPLMHEMAESVRDNPRTAVAGCHSSSKTFTAACLAWWWIACFAPAKVVITSPKLEQLRDVFWAELRARYERSRVPIGGELLMLHWKSGHPDTFIAGFTARKDTGADGATSMQGYKSPRLLLIMDEAVAIDRAFFTSAPGILTYPENRWLALANPTNPNCGFRDCWRSGSGWNTININAFDTPNLRENRIVNPHLPNAEWVDLMRAQYGEGSPSWDARVLGRFPSAAIDTLIGIADLEMAFGREPVPPSPGSRGKPWIGVDVARQGDDLSAIAVLRDDELVHLEWFQIPDLVKVSGEVLRVAHDFGIQSPDAHRVSVDATGMGWGVVDTLKANGWHVNAEDFGTSPRDETRFYDRRTELWNGVRDWLRSSASLSRCGVEWRRKLEADLCGCTVDPGRPKGGKTVLKLEKKSDMKKRLGHSPDIGDALALALAWRSRRRSLFDEIHRKPVLSGTMPRGIPYEHPAETREREVRRKPEFYDSGSGRGFYDD